MVELPDWLSPFFIFQKSSQNAWHLIHCLKSWHLIRGHNLTHICAVDMFPYKTTEPFQRSGFKSQLPKKPGNTPLSGTYLSFLDIKTTVSTCVDRVIEMHFPGFLLFSGSESYCNPHYLSYKKHVYYIIKIPFIIIFIQLTLFPLFFSIQGLLTFQ